MLTPNETRQAAELGWKLCDVYDLAKRRWLLTVMPVDFPARPARAAQLDVIMQAKQRVKVAVKALKLISSSKVS
jgi:hypothetical protein